MSEPVDIIIINTALISLGCEQIATKTEANKRARTMNALWPICRKAVLEDHPWSFAKTRVSLALLTSTPAFGWDYEYTLPTNCVNVIPHEKEIDAFPYKVEGGKLLCNEATTAYIQYIADTELSEGYSSLFKLALAIQLAIHACYDLTNSHAHESSLIAKYLDVLARARTLSSRQSTPESINGDTDMQNSDLWISSRL